LKEKKKKDLLGALGDDVGHVLLAELLNVDRLALNDGGKTNDILA